MKKAKENIRRASLAELRTMKDRGEIQTPRKNAKTYDVPEEFWANARPYVPAKKSIHLRVDEDVLAFFRAQGKGHLTRMNAVLRSYVNAQENDGRRAVGSKKSERVRKRA